MNIDNIVDYWVKSAEEDYKTTKSLLRDGRYVHSLFFCQLTLEKILKALVVQRINSHAPYDHSLIRLAELSGIKFLEKQNLDLIEISSFNIKGRYDDYRFKFYKKATKKYTEEYFKKTTSLYLWLKKQIKK